MTSGPFFGSKPWVGTSSDLPNIRSHKWVQLGWFMEIIMVPPKSWETWCTHSIWLCIQWLFQLMVSNGYSNDIPMVYGIYSWIFQWLEELLELEYSNAGYVSIFLMDHLQVPTSRLLAQSTRLWGGWSPSQLLCDEALRTSSRTSGPPGNSSPIRNTRPGVLYVHITNWKITKDPTCSIGKSW